MKTFSHSRIELVADNAMEAAINGGFLNTFALLFSLSEYVVQLHRIETTLENGVRPEFTCGDFRGIFLQTKSMVSICDIDHVPPKNPIQTTAPSPTVVESEAMVNSV
jgi:hypothetical protein